MVKHVPIKQIINMEELVSDLPASFANDDQLIMVRIICGVRFHDLTFKEAGEIISRISPEDSFEYVVTPNVDHVIRLNKASAEVRTWYDGAKLSLLDSQVLHRLAAFHPERPKAVIPGSSLVKWMFETIIAPGDPICIIGCTEEAVARLCRRYGLTNVSHHNPPMGFEAMPGEIETCVAFATARPFRFTFLAVGSPRQERLAHAIHRSGKARGLGLCIGTALNFLAGVEKRAPVWMQRAGLEWLGRLAGSPKRLWRRYLIDGPQVLPLIIRDYRAVFRARKPLAVPRGTAAER